MERHKLLLFICGTMLIVWGCTSPSAAPAATPRSTSAAGSSGAATLEPWQQQWEQVKTEARKEGTVVIAGNIGPAIDAITKTLREEYGITPEFISARGAEIVNKIRSEQNAGLYLVDNIFSTTTSVITVLKPEGKVERIDTELILPQVKDSKVWYQGRIPWVDNEKQYHIAFFATPLPGVYINSEMVKPDEIKSYSDLLDPRWKGKIIINDPTVTGSGNSWFTPLADEIGLEYFKKLLQQEPVLLRDQRLLAEWLARGKYPVLLGCDSQTTADFVNAGAPIWGIPLTEGAYTTQANGAISIAAKPPHPNAARVVLNWALSKEGGTILSRAQLCQSARVDVPTDFLPDYSVRKPGVKYVEASTEDYQKKKQDYIKIAQSVFASSLEK